MLTGEAEMLSCGKYNERLQNMEAKKHTYNIGDIYGMKQIIDLYRDENGWLVAKTRCTNCGRENSIRPHNLLREINQSCTCRRTRNNLNKKLYSIYHNMKYRCYNENAHEYENYGGRGIEVCDLWLGKDGYDRFEEWAITAGYKEGLSIDRINNDEGYSPQNCRWITRSENTRASNIANRKQRRKANNGTYCAISPSNEYIEFENAAQFSRENNLDAKHVRTACRNSKTYKGWRFGFVANNHSKPQSTIETHSSEGVEYIVGETPAVEAPSTET